MTESRRAASRENGRKSKGPKTEEGKRAVRHNALKHGILAKASLLPDEDPALFAALTEEIRSATQPVGALEVNLVELIASYVWRLRRVVQTESGLFAKPIFEARRSSALQEAESFRRRPPGEGPSELEALIAEYGRAESRDHWPIVDDDAYSAALERANTAQTHLEAEAVEIASAFSEDAQRADAFSKLSRYETTIERALFKASNELRALQRERDTDGS